MKETLKRWLPRLGLPLGVARQVRYELKLLYVRLRGALSPRQRWRRRQLVANTGLKVNLGCGPNPIPGWVNVDSHLGLGIDLSLDLRRRLPFANSSARFVFAEHVLEHLEYPEEARALLAECYRILAPGGVLRLGVPHLARFLEAYVAGDRGFFRDYSPTEDAPAEALNRLFRAGGFHRFLYDFETLERLLRATGFAGVAESSFRASTYPELNVDFDSEHRRHVTLYVEAVK